MKKVLLISLLICCGCRVQSQVEQMRFGIKLQSRLNLDLEIIRSVTFQGINPAFQYQGTKGFIHHIGIRGIGFGNSSFSGTRARNFFLSAAYEFSIPLGLFLNNERLRPYLGLGLATTSSSYFLDPSINNQFRQNGNTFIFGFYLMPSLQKDINDRLFLEFALPITLGDVTIDNTDTTDPSIPNRQQNVTRVNREFFNFEQFAFRFGFGVRL